MAIVLVALMIYLMDCMIYSQDGNHGRKEPEQGLARVQRMLLLYLVPFN